MAETVKTHHGNYNIEKRTQTVSFIVVHYTGAGNATSGNALANCKYFAGGNRNASAHYFIDDGDIYEYADPSTYFTWHCGDGNGKYGITNANSIGIEVCMNGDNPYTSAEINKLTWLVQTLMKKFKVAADHVVRHYDASRKACPFYYTPSGSGGDSAWKSLHKQITGGSTTYSGSLSSSSSSGSGEVITIDTATAYALGINAEILFAQEDIYPYVITINHKTESVLDFAKLKDADVVGTYVYIGSYFSSSHSVNSKFRSAKFVEQVEACIKNNMPFGLYTTLRARSVEEAKQELYEIKLAVRRYPPSLGLWIIPSFQKNKKKLNDQILNTYYDYLYNLGFNDQLGLYCKKTQLELITWKDHCEKWYWWMDRHLKSVDDIHQLPTPQFFKYDNPSDDLVKPDFARAAALLASGFSGSSAANDGSATDIQNKVAYIAEHSNSVTLKAGWCAMFVSDCYQQAGLTRPGGNAIDFWRNWKSSGGTDRNVPVGAVVVGSGYGYDGSLYGHVGIMLSGGRVAENIGGRNIASSIDNWVSGMNATCDGHRGYIGWVWPNNQDLSKMGKKTTSTQSSKSSSKASVSFYDFMSRGVVQGSGETSGYKFTYYSETVLPGGGLNIPGRHVSGGNNGQGYVMDNSNNIVLARPAGGKWNAGDVISTPFGTGKFYDYCPEGNIDVYVHY